MGDGNASNSQQQQQVINDFIPLFDQSATVNHNFDQFRPQSSNYWPPNQSYRGGRFHGRNYRSNPYQNYRRPQRGQYFGHSNQRFQSPQPNQYYQPRFKEPNFERKDDISVYVKPSMFQDPWAEFFVSNVSEINETVTSQQSSDVEQRHPENKEDRTEPSEIVSSLLSSQT